MSPISFCIAHNKRWSLVFFFLNVLKGSQLPCDCHMTESHVIVISPVKWPHTIGKIYVKMPSKSRQNRGSNGFSSRGTPSNRPDLVHYSSLRVNNGSRSNQQVCVLRSGQIQVSMVFQRILSIITQMQFMQICYSCFIYSILQAYFQ